MLLGPNWDIDMKYSIVAHVLKTEAEGVRWKSTLIVLCGPVSNVMFEVALPPRG